MMKAEEEQAKQAEKRARQQEQEIRQREQEREQRAKQEMKEEENARRNAQREAPETPRAKAKTKSGPSPKRPSPNNPSPQKKLEPVPIFPDGGEKASVSTYNPESEHEPKGRRGRPANTQPTNEVPPVKKKQPPNGKTPNMTPIGALASQEPTGTRNTRHMKLSSCIKEIGSGRDTRMEKIKNPFYQSQKESLWT